MKKGPLLLLLVLSLVATGCESSRNKTANVEQRLTEENQTTLLKNQPPPKLTWSLERDNLIRRFKLQNDSTLAFYMYIFVEGVGTPVGYYMVNKVSSVNSQLTNTEQIATTPQSADWHVIPSPAEDGSYGENGMGVFAFTPEGVYIEHNLHYLVSSIPLTFGAPVPRLAAIDSDEARRMLDASRRVMGR
jgi:hypothetical protein